MVVTAGIVAGLIVVSLGAGSGASEGGRIGGGGSMVGVTALMSVVLSSCWVGDEQLSLFGVLVGGGFGMLVVILWKPWYVRMLRVLATD